MAHDLFTFGPRQVKTIYFKVIVEMQKISKHLDVFINLLTFEEKLL